jgi:hypothetical protein
MAESQTRPLTQINETGRFSSLAAIRLARCGNGVLSKGNALGGQAAFIANGTPGEGVGKIEKGHATNRWILCGATFAMQSYSRIMRGPDCFEAAKGSRGSDPRLLRPNNGPATRPHIWGATPCIKDRPCPRVRPTLNYIIPSLNKTAN